MRVISISYLKERESELLSKKEEVIYRYYQSFSAIFTKYYLFIRFINREYDRFDQYQARVLFAKEFFTGLKSLPLVLTQFQRGWN
jgi:DNA mismatch repair protein MutS2